MTRYLTYNQKRADLEPTRPERAKRDIELAAAFQRGDKRAGDIICARHYPFVYRFVQRYETKDMHFEDLVQEGMIGLLEGFRRFQDEGGASPFTYAMMWVHAYLTKYVCRNHSIVDTPFNIADYSKKTMEKIKAHYKKELNGKQETIDAIETAYHEGVIGRNEYDHASFMAGGTRTSLDKFQDSTDKKVFGFEPAIKSHTPEAMRVEQDHGLLESQLYGAAIHDSLVALNDAQRHVITRSFGIGTTQKSFQEIGNELGVSGERVRQIRNKALAILKRDGVLREVMSV